MSLGSIRLGTAVMYSARVSEAEAERFWDERARENALYFVDNRLDYGDSDADAFWRGGQEALDQMLRAVGLTIEPGETVVDIGCGVGRITRALASRARWVYGIDVSSEMLVQARRHHPESANVEWLHGDGRSLAVLGDCSVDGCFSHVVFQHVPDPEIILNYVREMGRILRPGGWTLFQVSTDPAVHRRSPGLRDRARAVLRPSAPRHPDAPWWGSAVEVSALRAAASIGHLEVERLLDEGSQYTTVLARRSVSDQAMAN